MLIVDRHGAVRACGESLALLLGSPADHVARRPVWTLLPGWNPFDPIGVQPRLRLAAAHTSMPVDLSCDPLHLQDETLFILEVRPVRFGRELYAADAIMVTDHRGEILHVNAAFEAMGGFRRRELLGATPALLKSGAHDGRTYRKLWETLLDGEVYRGVLTNRRKNGELYREQKVIRPVRDAEGRPALFLASGREVGARARGVEPYSEGCAVL